ncbi:MAG: cellulase family glycosylhydrolase [Chitinispirillia bacterium]|nr:cellulase family glycosylhydrolase [Chitinispirillia bacterium]MCL2241742.1 cellulase family glycosylhydrolase [Chitinispirillia bacterium]
MKKKIVLMPAALLILALAAGTPAQVAAPLPAPGSPPAGSPVDKHGQLSTSGNKLKDKGGNDVVLRGPSMYWSNTEQSHFYSDDIVGWLVHDWKISVIRAAMGAWNEPHGGENAGYADGDQAAQWARVKVIIEGAIKRGIYVIVDWHTHNPGNYQSSAQSFFTRVATDYGAYPNIIYEIFNEPCGNGGPCGNKISDAQIQTWSNAMISSIRAKDTRNVIIIGTPDWSSQPNFTFSAPSNAGSIVYSMHFYAASHKSDYRDRTTAALNAGRPVFVSEFGSGTADGKGAHNPGETDTWINHMETHKISWVYWSVHNKCRDDEGTAVFNPPNPCPSTSAIANTAAQSLAGQAANWTSSNKPVLHARGTYIREKILSYNNTAYPNYPQTYAVNVTSGAGGRVEKRVNNTVNNGPYAYNAVVSIEAIPENGYRLDGWGGDASGTNTTLTYRVAGIPVNITASFTKESMIENGSFTQNFLPWSANGTGGTAVAENGEVKFTVQTPGTDIAGLRFIQNGIEIVKNAKYRLSFSAYGQSARPVSARITRGDRSTSAAAPYDVTLTASKQQYNYEFVSTQDYPKTPAGSSGAVWFAYGGSSTTWFLDDVSLECIDNCDGKSSIGSSSLSVNRAAKWTVSRTAGGLQLRGPADAGAKVLLYDVRGKLVKTMQAVDGLTVGAGLGAGNYLMVVKNGAGSEMLTARVPLVR